MSTMSDATAKEEVLELLKTAEIKLSASLLWPKGMNVVEFHDITNMINLLQEIQEDIRRR